eukprot:TRINITY_DN50357_c0_g1_i1.p1 TRINITY_DN50357_c0_g1~~TRINITY_DN50357_c0_g1_i1.p1  ORF type:complete len:331 (+),score=40.66 TRINITY_DN50357_c0_g1_i1:87-995(+)
MGASCGRWRPLRSQSCQSQDLGPLPSQDMKGVAAHMQGCKNVIVMVGAGLSVNAGIPDFRTPGSGLYDNLQKYNLPFPEAIFELDFFRKNQQPFYTLCKELWPGNFKPTKAHFFLSLLHRKRMLRRCFTQNIDSLEALAGLPKELIVAAHGNFDSASCVGTGRKVPPEEVRQAMFDGVSACKELNAKYGGLVKPDIVFFGENLPKRFFTLSEEDFPQCDLLIVIGTSLQVHPFASLVGKVGATVPRLLINMERAGDFRFDEPNMIDVFFQGDCDTGVQELVRLLGWEAEFADLLASTQSCKL